MRKGLLKEYRPPVQQQQQQYQQTSGMFVLRKIPIIPSSVSESVPDPAPDPVPTPDFPFQEFPLTEVVTQSQIDSSTQSSRDSSTISISDNSTTRESIPGIIPGIMTDTPSTPSTFPVETDIAEIPEEIQAQSNRSVIPTDIQALTALQSLVSDDFQAKNTYSTQRKGEETPDYTSRYIFYSKKRRRYTR